MLKHQNEENLNNLWVKERTDMLEGAVSNLKLVGREAIAVVIEDEELGCYY